MIGPQHRAQKAWQMHTIPGSTLADAQRIIADLRRQLDERIAERDEAYARERAATEVLSVINASAGNISLVFDAIPDKAHRLCGATRGTLFLLEGTTFRAAAAHGYAESFVQRRRHGIGVSESPLFASLAAGAPLVHHPDLRLLDNPVSRATAEQGVRTELLLPLRKNGVLLGIISCNRTEVLPFTATQIALLQTFAEQAVVAIENARLLEEVQSRTRALEQSLDDLRRAQDRLVQTEKLASLGQLTAGIAHEIKNPLNFVNNFAALSSELADELREALALEPLSDKVRGDVDDVTGMLKENLNKVVQHGKRADAIVRTMLLHSRPGSGEQRAVDVNAIIEESLSLAYHGARAETPGFDIALSRDLDPAAGAITAFPQEMSRAFLNLFANGFYAATQRKHSSGDGFEPLLSVVTKNLGDGVEIRVRDNGVGIAAEVREKIFNPFFTTKPAGEGTGLGLSLTHDIIVKQHGGVIEVASTPGIFTEFRVYLPRGGARSPLPEAR